jgi:bacterioferritin-associated ferredoxin
MNLCHCNSLTEEQIAEAIAAGARSVERVFAHWRSSQLCGACRGAILKMLAADERRRRRRRRRTVPVTPRR